MKQIVKSIQFCAGRYKFNLNLKSGLTIIGGRSSTGKTLLYEKYRAYCRINKIENVVFINKNSWSGKNNMNNILNDSGKIFIIDNADILVNDRFGEHVHKDEKNQYIIMGRRNDIYLAEKENVAVLINKGTEFKLLYLYMEKE